MAALKQQLQQKLQQKLSPQQIQLIRLLELTEIEFEERVQQELVDNPALEEGREEIPDSINEFDANADEDGNPGESAEELTLGDYRNEEDIPDYRLKPTTTRKMTKKKTFHSYRPLHFTITSKASWESFLSTKPPIKLLNTLLGI